MSIYEENELSYLGTRYGKDNHLEVVCWGGHRHSIGGGKLYTVKCDVCSLDPEMFGAGLFLATKSNLEQGAICCGCGASHKYSEKQQRLRVERRLRSTPVEFVSFIGEYYGVRTKTRLRCNRHNAEWDGGTVNSVLIGILGCRFCVGEGTSRRHTLTYEHEVKEFMKSGSFLAGTVFTKVENGGYGRWYYECPECSYDKFVKAGVCTGKFYAVASSLKKGSYACRCSPRYTFSAEQRQMQVEEKLKEENSNLTFLRWSEPFKNDTSKLILFCPEHGEREVVISKFLSRRRRCTTCTKGGYDRSKESVVYTLLAEGQGFSFTGYGVSTVHKTRMATHRRNLKKCGMIVVASEMFTTSGSGALQVEKMLKTSFERYPQEVEGFLTEATYPELYEDVVNFIKQQTEVINENNQTALVH